MLAVLPSYMCNTVVVFTAFSVLVEDGKNLNWTNNHQDTLMYLLQKGSYRGYIAPFLHSSFKQRSPLFHLWIFLLQQSIILSLDVHTIQIYVYTLVSRP